MNIRKTFFFLYKRLPGNVDFLKYFKPQFDNIFVSITESRHEILFVCIFVVLGSIFQTVLKSKL